MTTLVWREEIESQSTNPDPRQTMGSLPRFVQPFLTWLTGKPLPGERPWNLRPVHHLLACLVPIAIGITTSILAVHFGRWLLLVLLPAWLLTTHGIRKLRTMILHQCSHGNFWRRPWPDRVVGTVIAMALISQEYEGYKREHVGDHHSNGHMTMADPTVQFLVLTVGARGGMPKKETWRRMLWTLVSPKYHLRAMAGRVASHFCNTPTWYRIAFVLSLFLQLAVVTLTHSWLMFAVVWLVPVTVLFNASALCRLSSRHIFPAQDTRQRGRAGLASYTHGILIGEAAPSGDPALEPVRVRAWGRWWLRMLLVHLPTRLFVLVGDGPAHDFHHRHPRAKDWANYIFARASDIAEGHPGWPPYTEVWGLHSAIDACFESLSKADPDEFRPQDQKRLSTATLVAAIEE